MQAKAKPGIDLERREPSVIDKCPRCPCMLYTRRRKPHDLVNIAPLGMDSGRQSAVALHPDVLALEDTRLEREHEL
eukprot:1288844-Pyramimonas_sp.AAC.1